MRDREPKETCRAIVNLKSFHLHYDRLFYPEQLPVLKIKVLNVEYKQKRPLIILNCGVLHTFPHKGKD